MQKSITSFWSKVPSDNGLLCLFLDDATLLQYHESRKKLSLKQIKQNILEVQSPTLKYVQLLQYSLIISMLLYHCNLHTINKFVNLVFHLINGILID